MSRREPGENGAQNKQRETRVEKKNTYMAQNEQIGSQINQDSHHFFYCEEVSYLCCSIVYFTRHVERVCLCVCVL